MKDNALARLSFQKRFSLTFMLWCAALYALIDFILPAFHLTHFFEAANRYNAAMTGFIFKLLGMDPLIQGTHISLDGFRVKIITECSAFYHIILLFAFIMAYSSSSKQKTIGLLFGIPILWAGNIVRIVGVCFTGVKYPDFFAYVHVYFGQIIMILFVLTISLTWLRSVVMIKTTDKPSSFFIRFIAISIIPFLLWLFLHKGYVWINLNLIKFFLSLFGCHFELPSKLDLYPHTFNSFNLISFSGLVLATKSLGSGEKIKALIGGLAILSAMHLVFTLFRIFFFSFHVRQSFWLITAMIILHQWVLPFALWLFLIRKEIFKRKGIFTCPVCGAEKVGIIQHIKAKHGAGALKDKRVMFLLAEL